MTKSLVAPTAPLDLAGAHKRFRQALGIEPDEEVEFLQTSGVEFPHLCESCKFYGKATLEGVELESSRTAYHWDGKGDDPNRSVWFCRPCAKEHHAHWDAQWSEVQGGL